MMTGSGAKIAGGVEQPARVKAVQVAASAVSDFFICWLPEVELPYRKKRTDAKTLRPSAQVTVMIESKFCFLREQSREWYEFRSWRFETESEDVSSLTP